MRGFLFWNNLHFVIIHTERLLYGITAPFYHHTMKKIKIYTTPRCVYCRMAKDFFKEHNVSYEEYNVAEDDKARDEMIAKSEQLGVPVIDIDGEIFIGFDKNGIAKALNL